jgi:protein SCO1
MNSASRLPTALAVLLGGVAAASAWMAMRPTVWADDFRLTTLPDLRTAPDFQLTDFNGRPRSLLDYRGRVVVMFFGFTRCPNACPTELFTLAQVMKRLGPASDHVQVLFITLDPERDTPKLLRGYVTAFDPRFVGLTGTMEQIDSAANSYHVMHVKELIGDDYTIGHSTASYVLDAQGRQRLKVPLDATVDDFAHDVAQLTRGLE